MALVQAYRRNKTYTHTFADAVLVFKPNETGDVVCDVQDPAHVARLLRRPAFACMASRPTSRCRHC